MRKLHKAAVAAAIIASIGFIGTGTATAQGAESMRGGGCKSHDLNLDLLGNVGLLNGVIGVNDEGSPGAQFTHVGSDMGCDHDGR
ncbi:hypothetical protein AB0D27_13945 [Streptomyces sp. NPDC048415]|jgi:hypothetical protein|uniref:hypothetical protein n=1 Tax=Streptomyces sp. NPDC048415 TaxID=3154822 RepID=UPI00343C3264